MITAELPENEAARLSDLKAMNLLNTPISKAFERITRLTKALFNTPIVAISIVEGERQWFKSIQGLDVCETSREVSFCSHTILNDQFFIVSDAEKDVRFADNPLVTGDPHIRFYAGYPIKSKQGFNVGALCIIDRIQRDLSAEDLDPLKDMAALVEEELANQKKNQAQYQLINELDEAKRFGMIDSLTRTWNRGGIEQILAKQTALSKEQNKSFGLAIIDLDNFKHINDTHGHCAGDHVLRTVTKIMLESLRDKDAIGRWGGEEFLIIIDNEDKSKLQEIMERARKVVHETEIYFDKSKIDVSFTSGLTMVEPLAAQDTAELIKRVDKALYQGKASGKNTVVFI